MRFNRKQSDYFSDKETPVNYYRTGILKIPDLSSGFMRRGPFRFRDSRADVSLLFLLTWVLPLAVFIMIGRFISKKMLDQVGGMGAMSFGKSNAKVYVESRPALNSAM